MILVFDVIISLQATQARQAFAFARDGALPASPFWHQLSGVAKLPLNALALVTVLDALVILPALGSSVALNAIVSIGTIGGYLTCKLRKEKKVDYI